MKQPVHKVSELDVERVIKRDFAPTDVEEAKAIVAQYADREPHRVRLAALRFSDGSLHALRDGIKRAIEDYREVLVDAEYPEYFRSSSRLTADEFARQKQRIIDYDWRQYQGWLNALTKIGQGGHDVHRECEDELDRIDVRTPGEFREMCKKLAGLVAEGRVEMLSASHDFSEVQSGEPWPGDILSWRVRAKGSGNTYLLWADTYHGRVEWRREDSGA